MLPIHKHIKKVIIHDSRSSPKARAERLRRVRNMANLTREEMCNSEGLNINTYKGWEIARYGGLPVDGAVKTISRVAKKGVICTIEWLLHGVGVGPYVVPEYQKIIHGTQLSKAEHDPALDREKQCIQDEIKLFKELFAGTISYEIEDDGLAPFYLPGDFVAGISRHQEEIHDVLEKHCIVQTETGSILARYLRPGEKPNTYTLLCSNVKTSVEKPTLYDVKLISAAPIIRHYQNSF